MESLGHFRTTFHTTLRPASPRQGEPSSRSVSLHMEVSRRKIRRSYSESDVTRSDLRAPIRMGSRIQEATECNEFMYYEGGMNRNWNSGGGGRNESDGNRNKIGAYYQEMLKSEPTNSLLLRNYGKYLDEVERDKVKAEEYYGRAILEGGGDGEVLSLYGKLIWETERDGKRAGSYFNQALQASPQDSMVLGSYAHFLWEAEEEEEQEMEETTTVPMFEVLC